MNKVKHGMEKVAAKPFGSAEHITAAYAPTGAGFEDAQRVIPTHTGPWAGIIGGESRERTL